MRKKSVRVPSSALRDTRPRRLVLGGLMRIKGATDPRALHRRLRGQVDLVTVYRVLRAFEAHGIVHRHPSSGGYALCTMPEAAGHHGFLSCRRCGNVEEFLDPALCRREDRIAESSGFSPERHVSDIIGLCLSCQ
jgi:Fe2+ or Zn2+ uptake regulation protein